MLKRILGIFIFILGFSAATSQAQTLTTVTNYTSATNGCSAKFVIGLSIGNVFEVNCPSVITAYTLVNRTTSAWSFMNGTTRESTSSSVSFDLEIMGTGSYYTLNKIAKNCVAWNSSTINIGMSCNGQYYCAEAFGRTCYAQGGTTEVVGGSYSCVKKSCSSWASIPKAPVCTTTNINIGQSCNGEYWCAESFGRACSSAGGLTSSNYGSMVCSKTVCQ